MLLGLACLTGLASNDLSGVTNTLALVRLGGSDASNTGGLFTNDLLVDAANRDTIIALDCIGHAIRGDHANLVRVAHVQDEMLAIERGAVPNSKDFEILGVPIGNTDNHVVD
jgi:hypothetical protein